ncbi:DUF460 domain-containing protein [Candidatus Woesearchaeota archaeon]|nr:DUF460 domain-containing protein [Candidatus Woesearchaeota archaeon]
MRQLIVGVDPGTTLGYAVLDIDGKILKLGSSKQLNLSALITEVIGLGRPLIVGCDKHSVPDFVSKFSTKIGARSINPEEDLHVIEKKEIIYHYVADTKQAITPANLHEADALAAAIFAFRRIRTVLEKINNFVVENKKQEHKQRITEIVLLNDALNIKEAFEMIQRAEKSNLRREEDVLAIKYADKKKHFNEQDYLKLYSKLKSSEKEINLLRNQNTNLQNMLKNAAQTKVKKIKILDKDSQDRLQFKENRIHQYQQLLHLKSQQAEILKNEISLLNIFLTSLKENLLMKKLNTLSYNEYSVKNALLNISPGDVLLVNDLSIFSAQTVKELEDKVSVIVYRKNITNKIKQAMPFILLPAEKLNMQESKDFAVCSNEQFMRAKNNSNILSEIVEQYRKDRCGV